MINELFHRLDKYVVNNLQHRPLTFLIITLLACVLLVNAWTLIPHPYTEGQNQVHPEYWSFLFVVFAPYVFGTSLLMSTGCRALHGEAWLTEKGIRPLVEMTPMTIVPVLLGCLISVFPDEIRLPLIHSKIWWPALLLVGSSMSFSIYIWNARAEMLRKQKISKGDFDKGFISGPSPPAILKTAAETPDDSNDGVVMVSGIAPELYTVERAVFGTICMSLSAASYLLGQIFSHFYFLYAPYDFVTEIVLIEAFKISIKVVSLINLCIVDTFIGDEVMSTLSCYFSELAFYIFYRNLFTSKMNSAWTVVGLCVLNAGIYGLLPIIFMSRWGFRNLQLLQLFGISPNVSEDQYRSYVLLVARKMIANALATVVSMISFFVWSLGTRYISNEVHFMTYGRTHHNNEEFFAILNKSAGTLASEVFAIGLGFWWANKYHNCNPMREFVNWMIKNPSFYYCFLTTTCHILGDLVIALISINFV